MFQIKLDGINAKDISEGNSKTILGLLWNIIVHFQVKIWRYICLPIVLIMPFVVLFTIKDAGTGDDDDDDMVVQIQE